MINPNDFEEEWGWVPDYGFDVVSTNDPDGKITKRQSRKALKNFDKSLKKLLKEAKGR